MKIDLKVVDSAVIFLGILWFSRYFNFILEDFSEGTGVKGPSILFQLVSLSIYAYSFVRLLKRKSFVIYQISYNPFPLLLIAWCALSVLWSIEFALTLRRVIALFGMFSFSLFIASYISERDKFEILAYPLAFGMLSSYFLVVFMPGLGISDGSNVPSHEGLWKGVYGFKNTLAVIVSFLIIFLLNQQFNRKVLLTLILACVMLYNTKSTSSLTSILGVMGMLCLLQLVKQRKYALFIALSSIFLLIASLVLLNIEYIVYEVIGKDMTASGRTEIWRQILSAVQGKFLGLGYGGVFWGMNSLAFYLMDDNYINIGHAHNGYIDARLELGIPGVFLYVGVLLFPIYKSMKYFHRNHERAVLTISFFTFLAIYSLSGSGFLRVNSAILLFTLLMSQNMFLYQEKAK